MLRRDRIMTVITVTLLNFFTVGAGAAVVNLTPERRLAPSPPAVADRVIVQTRSSLAQAATDDGPMPNTTTLGTRLNGLLGVPGASVSAVVMDASSRQLLYNRQASVPAVPASTTKVLTSTAALAELGPDHRLTTKVVRAGGASGSGTSPGTGTPESTDGSAAPAGSGSIILVGGGDPTLSSAPTAAMSKTYPRPASLADLARSTAAVLKSEGVRKVRVDYDVSAYQGGRTAPTWKPNYVSDGEIAPVSALMVNEGRVAPAEKGRVADPSATALGVFVRTLEAAGVEAEAGSRTTAPADAQQLAQVQSPPLSALVEEALTASDNDLAEALARQVAIKRGNTPDFEGSAAAVMETLAGLGVDGGVQTHDGSGLSPQNQVTPLALAQVLSLAASDAHPELRAVITGLPVAGFSGTLALRYTGPAGLPGAGIVRAKTGTLAGVNTLAGVTYDADGRLLVFALMANEVKAGFDAPGLLDSLAASLASCGCA